MAEPKVRFKKNDGSRYLDWEEKKLGDVASRVTRKNKNNETDIPLTIASIEGLVDQRTYFGKTIASRDMSGYYLLNKGEYAYNKSYSKGYDYGSIKRLDNYENGALSTLYICFALNESENSDFYNCYFNGLSWYNQMREICAEGARNHGLLNVSANDFFNITLSIPADGEEQQKISDFFKNVDSLISTSEKEVEKLQELKRGCLQKMFPRNGASVPEVRFPEFTGDWEQRKLSELGEIMTGSTPSTTKSEYYSDNGLPWVTPTDIESNIISDSPRRLSEEGVKVARVVPANTILCTCIASIGKNALLTVKGSFNQQINSLTPNDDNDPYFLLTESEIWSNHMKRMAASGTMQIVNKTEFSELLAMVPKYDEQKRIGEYFLNLDNLITLHQRECEKYRELKKGLLQQMFA